MIETGVRWGRGAAVVALVAGLAACSLVGDSAGGGKGGGKTGDIQGSRGPGGPAGPAGPGGGGGPGGPQRAPAVVVDTVATRTLSDRIEAVGTAVANEQADLNSTVTERIARVNFTDGAFVRKGAIIAELVRGEQGAALSQAEARLKEATSQLERLRALQKQGFATRAQIETAEASVDVARAQVAASTSQIGDRVIRAPFSGWLSLRRISPGTVVTAGTPIATIVDYSRIKLDFPVPEVSLSAVAPGTPIKAVAAAFPDRTFAGRVSSIDPIIDPVTRAATVRAILPNDDRALKPGMLMTVVLESRSRTAPVVPELALVGLGEQRFVFRVDSENVANRVPVRTGQRRDGMVEIVSGLAPGDRIVVEGTVKVRDGLTVRPVEAAVLRAPAGSGRT